MRIAGLHSQIEKALKKKEPSSKLSGTVIKNFKAEGRVAVLMPDGSTKLVQVDSSLQSGETLYFDEKDLLLLNTPKKDTTELEQDKPLKASEFVQVLSQKSEKSPLGDMLKELSKMLQGASVPKSVSEKVNQLIYMIKNEITLFISSEQGASVDKVFDVLKELADSTESSTVAEKQLLDKLNSVEKKLFAIMINHATSTLKEGSDTLFVREMVQSVLTSAESIKRLVNDKPDLLMTSLRVSDLQDRFLPSLAKEVPEMSSFVSELQKVPKSLETLYLVTSPENEKEVVEKIPEEQTAKPVNKGYSLLGKDFAFMSLYTQVKSSCPKLSKLVAPELLTETLMKAEEVEKPVLKSLEDYITLTTKESGTNNSPVMPSSIKSILEFLVSSKVEPSLPIIKSLDDFNAKGEKLLQGTLLKFQEVGKVFMNTMAELSFPPKAEIGEQFTTLVEKVRSFEALLHEPLLSSELKEKGLESILLKLGILPDRNGKLQGTGSASLRQLADQVTKEIAKIEVALKGGDDESPEKLRLKEILSTLKERSSDIIKNLSTISLLAKPAERSGIVEQMFYMPVTIAGEEVSMRLKVKRNKKGSKNRSDALDGTQVEISMELKKLGKIESRLQLTKSKKLSVAISSGSTAAVQWFRNNLREIYASLENSELKSVSLIIDGVRPFQEKTKRVKKSRIEFTG